ncbi:MCE family protein [Actinomadura graeca]|uniref:MCE family protein n=1 Tax=Actinomadura graeca TaxID=2750812 RepID=A0ABX8QS63_9ACTN|nr:MCE family protein [Actinomadura graeca]QXJ21655.1 MCE family protein [Actinomadura graeca]
MTGRVAVNLAVFAALAVTMVVWAFGNVVRFDFIDRPYHVTVEFASSPGLHPGFEADYLGLRVGKIDSVRLERGRVIVRLDIERGVRIPRNATAAAARKSAVGEPVVELSPGPGGAGAPPLGPGARIPVSRTTVPPKYGDLFGSVVDALKAVDPGDARILTHELAAGWAGRENSLRKIVDGGDQLTGTFAANTELLDRLTRDLGRVTRVLNRNRAALGSGVDDLAALVTALAQVRGRIADLLDEGPGLLSTVDTLLARTGPDVECAVDALGNWGLRKHDPDVLADLRRTLALAPQLKTVLDNVIGMDQGRPILNVVFLVTLRKLATLEYKYPLPQPGVTRTPTCAGGRMPAQTAQKPYKARNPGDTIPTHDPSVGGRDVRAGKAANSGGEPAGGPPAWLVYVPPVIALLVLIRVATGSVPVVSRLRRKKD